MNYRDGLVKETEFFTTAELAQKLKMNVQVIARKIQSGEMMAYKVGKDWRIPEKAVFAWLEERSNKSTRTTSVVVNNSPKSELPSVGVEVTRSRRKHLLEFILAQFEPTRNYSEDDVNRVIGRYDGDIDRLRAELLSESMMERTGKFFRRRQGYKLSD
jgi:excisionase family DNA binding protein